MLTQEFIEGLFSMLFAKWLSHHSITLKRESVNKLRKLFRRLEGHPLGNDIPTRKVLTKALALFCANLKTQRAKVTQGHTITIAQCIHNLSLHGTPYSIHIRLGNTTRIVY